MDIKKLSLAAAAGGVTLFILGAVFYVGLLESFFNEAAGTSANVYRAEPLMWAIFLGELCAAVLITYIFQRWATIKTLKGGVKGGAVIGLLLGLAINLTMYGTTTMSTLPAVLVDAAVTTIRFSLAGGVIGWLLGRE